MTAINLNNIYGNIRKSYENDKRAISLLHDELIVEDNLNEAYNFFDPNTFVELGMHISCIFNYQDTADFVEEYSGRNKNLSGWTAAYSGTS